MPVKSSLAARGRKIFTRLALIGALGGPVVPGATPLDAPLRSLLSPLQLDIIRREVARSCPDFNLTGTTPIRDVLADEFYHRCLSSARSSARRLAREENSPFYRPLRRGAEYLLREALAPQWLTLRMTNTDLLRYAAAEPIPDLKPLSLIQFRGAGGRPVDGLRMKAHGLFVVRDFLTAFAADMDLPSERRFIKGYRANETTALRHKVAIEQNLAPVPAAADWLRRVRDHHDPDSPVAAACALLLKHYDATKP